MKKFLALMLAVLFCLSMVACGGGDDKSSDEPVKSNVGNNDDVVTDEPETEEVEIDIPETEEIEIDVPGSDIDEPVVTESVEDFVEANGDMLLELFEQGFTAAGLTCNSTVVADGNDIVFDININELENVDDATKAQMQESYDQQQATFDAMAQALKTACSDLEGVVINVCDKDGNVCAVIEAEA